MSRRRSPLMKNYGHIYRTHLLKRASNKYLKRERERERERERKKERKKTIALLGQ
jgi:hypothetical protein